MLTAVAVAALASCRGPEGDELAVRRYSFTSPAMGSEFRIVLFAADSALAHRAAREAFELGDSIEAIMSDYRPNSELNRLSATAGSGSDVFVSDPLMRILLMSHRISELTDGAFDVTAGSVTRLWRRSMRRGELPPDHALEDALRSVGYRALVLDSASQSVRIESAGMRLDLGGIAKGFAADRMLERLRSAGLPHALVDAAGDIAAGDPPPDQAGWRIALDGHTAGRDSLVLIARNRGIATSGDRFRYVESDGLRYSHIVDPSTGYGVTHTQSVTVLAPSATTADAFASAFAVMPAPDAIRLAESQQSLEARILSRPGSSAGPLLRETSGFSDVLLKSSIPGSTPDS